MSINNPDLGGKLLLEQLPITPGVIVSCGLDIKVASGHQVLDILTLQDSNKALTDVVAVVLYKPGASLNPLALFTRVLQALAADGVLLIVDTFATHFTTLGASRFNLLSDFLALATRFNFDLNINKTLSVNEGQKQTEVLLKFTKGPPPKWKLQYLNKQHLDKMLSLFELSFNTQMSKPLWQWKYASEQASEVCVWEQETLIAHYGGMPRHILFFGEKHMAVQIGDVMVNPSHRGALRRTGPFFMMAATFMERYTGFGKPFVISFGFPNDRAMKVAAHLNLYDSLGHMEQLSWLPIYKRPKLLTTLRVIDQNSIVNFEHAINILWQHMADDLKKAMIGVRDYNYIIDRYVNHPENSYQILIVKSRFSRKIHSLIVIQITGEHCHIIDVIAPIKKLSLLIQYTQRFAQTNRCTRIICQISNAFSRYFETTDSHREALNIQIASDIWSKGPDVSILRNKFWLMSGDMDFR